MRQKVNDNIAAQAIEKLLLPDTPDSISISTIKGKEKDYLPMLLTLQSGIILYLTCTNDRNLTDRGINEAVGKIKLNLSVLPSFDGSSIEDCIRIAACEGLRLGPMTKHEFLLCIDHIERSIKSASTGNDEKAYVNALVNFFKLLPKKIKEANELQRASVAPSHCSDMNSRPAIVKGTLSLKRAGKNSWYFHHPQSWDSITGKIYDALEMMESQNAKHRKHGIASLRKSVEMADTHPLAWSEYGFFLWNSGRKDEGKSFVGTVVSKGRKLFPEGFSAGKDLIEWGFLENRPFHRCMHWLALDHIGAGRHGKALELLEQMLSLNPNDNLGARELAVDCLLALNRPQDVLALCDKYGDDTMPGILYGRPLAFLQLGKKDEARKALVEAMEFSPLIAKELIKPTKTRPQETMEGYAVSGGRDEAWDYRQASGIFWYQTEGALEFLRQAMESSK